MQIKLTQGFFAEIDDEDYPLISKYNWQVLNMSKSGKQNYAFTSINRQTKLMHRIIMGANKGDVIDHIDHNGLNNRRSNLRFCTVTQNNQNFPIRKNNKSGFRGVYFGAKKYIAEITCSGKKICAGRFDNPEDAARAYDKKARELFGEFANTNFKDKDA